MLLEYSFKGNKGQTCYLALCDDEPKVIKETAKNYFKSHGLDKTGTGSFVFFCNSNGDYVALTATKEIDEYALEYALACYDGFIGQRISVPNLFTIIKQFQKDINR